MKHISKKMIAASILGLCVISSVTPCTLAAMPVSTPVIGYKMQRTIGITVLPTLSIKMELRQLRLQSILAEIVNTT